MDVQMVMRGLQMANILLLLLLQAICNAQQK